MTYNYVVWEEIRVIYSFTPETTQLRAIIKDSGGVIRLEHPGPTFESLTTVPSAMRKEQEHLSFRSLEVSLQALSEWVKVKVTLVQALRLCTGRTTHRRSRGIALPFRDHDTRRGWVVSVTPRPLFTPGKEPVPIVQEVEWAPGPGWTGAENLTPTGIRSPDLQPVASHYTDYATRPTPEWVAGLKWILTGYLTILCNVKSTISYSLAYWHPLLITRPTRYEESNYSLFIFLGTFLKWFNLRSNLAFKPHEWLPANKKRIMSRNFFMKKSSLWLIIIIIIIIIIIQ